MRQTQKIYWISDKHKKYIENHTNKLTWRKTGRQENDKVCTTNIFFRFTKTTLNAKTVMIKDIKKSRFEPKYKQG